MHYRRIQSITASLVAPQKSYHPKSEGFGTKVVGEWCKNELHPTWPCIVWTEYVGVALFYFLLFNLNQVTIPIHNCLINLFWDRIISLVGECVLTTLLPTDLKFSSLLLTSKLLAIIKWKQFQLNKLYEFCLCESVQQYTLSEQSRCRLSYYQ